MSSDSYLPMFSNLQLGFFILAFAPMPMFASCGLLTAIMISMAAAAALLVLPSLLVLVTKDHAGEPTTPDVAWAGFTRLQHQAALAPNDSELTDLVQLAETAVAGLPRPRSPGSDLVICPWFRFGDTVIRTISIAARFDTAVEITLAALRIELAYPQDAIAERFFRRQAK